MKKILLLLLLSPLFTQAQIIVTIAGTGVSGLSGDGGPATAALMTQPWGMTRDNAGNIYFSDNGNNKVRKIDTAGIITEVAGDGTAAYSGDGGPATAAGINGPTAVVVYKGNIYIAEGTSSRVRKIDATGTITTFAGNGAGGLHGGYSGDGGPATDASISGPLGLAVDRAGNFYISDQFTNHVRKVDTFGMISTIAGNGISGYSGDGGPATDATMSLPDGIAVDSAGNVYFSDFDNNVVRKVDTAGIISTYAGVAGTGGFSGDAGPATAAQLWGAAGLNFDSAGNLYISDATNNRVRLVSASGIINTIAGFGKAGYGGDYGSPLLAELDNVNLACPDPAGNVYIGDMYNKRIRKIIAPISLNVCMGTATLSDTLFPGGIWSSTNTGIATVGTTGVITGLAIGSSVISYNSGIYGTVNIITTPAAPLAITGAVTVCVGSSITLSDATVGGAWSSGATSLATAGSAGIITGVAVGVDTIRYTVSNSCGSADVHYLVTVKAHGTCVSGVNDIEPVSGALRVYPNPATTELTVAFSDRISNIAITNLVGQTIYTHEYNTAQVQVNVAGLPAGMYFIKVNDLVVSKFMKE